VLADRVKQTVEVTAFPLVAPGVITVSIGVATYPENGITAGELLEAADVALYAAKQAGRNQVSTAATSAAGRNSRARGGEPPEIESHDQDSF
jgi:diguanylate cyclase (GGDEF)-like protein